MNGTRKITLVLSPSSCDFKWMEDVKGEDNMILVGGRKENICLFLPVACQMQ